MTTAAVMQPTYLPWLGYLDLMDQVDTFVLLDTVQFDYRSWQHRNRIPAPAASRPGSRCRSPRPPAGPPSSRWRSPVAASSPTAT